MEKLLSNVLIDNTLYITFIFVTISCIILGILNISKKVENSQNEYLKYYAFWVIIIPVLVIILLCIIFKKIIMALLLLLFIIIYGLYKTKEGIKLIKKENDTKQLSEEKQLNIIFPQMLYIFIFSTDMQKIIIDFIKIMCSFIFNTNNQLYYKLIIYIYLTFKLISIIFFISINIVFFIRNIYKIFNFKKITKKKKNKKINFDFRQSIIISNNQIINKVNKLKIHARIPIIVLILYYIIIINSLKEIIIDIVYFPIKIFKKILQNEQLFIYILLLLSILISISLTYNYIVVYETNEKLEKIFSFFGITIIAPIILSKLFEKNKED